MLSSAVVIHAKYVSQVTFSTTWEFVNNLRARDNDLADQIGQTHVSLTFRLVDNVQFVSGRNLSLVTLNPAIEVVHTLASKTLHTPLFTMIEWSSSGIQPTKIFHLTNRILKGRALCLL